MVAEPLAVTSGVVRAQRRSLLLWSLALTAVTIMYVGLYPSFETADIGAMTENLPDTLNEAFGYDQIGTPTGYLTSTVYGLLGPLLLLVFAIATGARLLAGQEEDGTLELEFTAPVERRRLYVERLAALWLDVVLLVAVVTVTVLVLIVTLDIDVAVTGVLAGSTGMLLLVLGFATLAYAVGAITGRRTLALGVAAGLAVLAFIFDALGPSLGADWMTAVSPFSWYLEPDPIAEGFDLGRLALLAAVPLLAAAAGAVWIDRRDLMV
jgi:ABC-2 type transport system permease protein